MIKNLLFDLGGVIMDIRRQNCEAAFRELGMAHPEDFLGDYCQSGVFKGIEDGSASEEEFHKEIRDIIGKPVTDREIDTAFGKFLIGIPEHRLAELECLHHKYGIYMISNTNPIMWKNGIAENFHKAGHDVNYYFDGIVKSYESRSMKPDPKIFEDVISKFGIKPEETLFLDDSERNLEAARRFGFQTLLVAPGQEFYTLLNKEGISC